MDDDLVVSARLVVPASELRERFSHSSGPGGQGVNTSDSRVELVFDLQSSAAIPQDLRARMMSRLATRLVDGRVTVAASDQRSQLANRRQARRRLAQLLREAAAPPPRPRSPTRPTRGSIERRITGKKRRGQIKKRRARPQE